MFMFAKHPDIAKRWEDETPSMKALPEKVGKKKKRRRFGDDRQVDDYIKSLMK